MAISVKEYARLYRIRNLEKIRENEKRYRYSEKGKKTKRLYMKKRWIEYRNTHGIEARKFGISSYSRRQYKLLEKIAKRDGRFCAECGATEDLTVNHIIPFCVGGKTVEENLNILCRSCNIKSYQRLVKKALKSYFLSLAHDY